MFLDQQRVPKKLYRGGYDQKKSQNENSQRWIDSQLNSASFKTDFKLKWQKKNKTFSKNHIFLVVKKPYFL